MGEKGSDLRLSVSPKPFLLTVRLSCHPVQQLLVWLDQRKGLGPGQGSQEARADVVNLLPRCE